MGFALPAEPQLSDKLLYAISVHLDPFDPGAVGYDGYSRERRSLPPFAQADVDDARKALAAYRQILRTGEVTRTKAFTWLSRIVLTLRNPPGEEAITALAEAMAFVMVDVPDCILCDQTQRMAMERIVYSPSMADISGVLKPIYGEWQRRFEALGAIVTRYDPRRFGPADEVPDFT